MQRDMDKSPFLQGRENDRTNARMEESMIPTAELVPNQLHMRGGGIDALHVHPNLFVKQTRKGWLQEMLGCEAKTEFNIATIEDKHSHIMYALEESTFLERFLCPMLRSWNMNVWEGQGPEGPGVAQYHRPFRMAPHPCKCCCFQEVQHMDHTGAPIGSTVEGQYCFVPRFTINDASGNPQFTLSQPTCVGGLCVDICAEGFCNCRVPFYVYPLGANHVAGFEVGKIVKIWYKKSWSGLATEMFTDADKFELEFPADESPETKARLLGSLFLLNQLFFEVKHQN
mmetsp:Transcript_47108/g.112291  ORF Transcript_47108/g.112291 Transcript_47108/m.112291 type:complete len:284 (+) Transcript_47108:150-1001(+)|eukprot:CAMPEP_0180132316 /NCGR_PEP_ID=MMETSP0986-20121125/8914_1 /TAXON_ID=697907 /ORGANISM="non described non described, Strain CCMP2293" /LENGTH=283 /DNA_ID=CAMNT_0022072303 /DNA_START=148 /DNA_END=1002 /DNA_ORIENTATION=+